MHRLVLRISAFYSTFLLYAFFLFLIASCDHIPKQTQKTLGNICREIVDEAMTDQHQAEKYPDPDAGKKSLKQIINQCNDGHMEACCEGGRIYLKGTRDIPADIAAAESFMLRSCEGGYALCCKNVLQIYFTYENGRWDYTKATKILDYVCSENFVPACRKLGFWYCQGQGVPYEPEKGKSYFLKACDAGDQDSCILIREHTACSSLHEKYQTDPKSMGIDRRFLLF